AAKRLADKAPSIRNSIRRRAICAGMIFASHQHPALLLLSTILAETDTHISEACWGIKISPVANRRRGVAERANLDRARTHKRQSQRSQHRYLKTRSACSRS